MYEYFCTNPDCTEVDVPKIALTLFDPEVAPIVCGALTNAGVPCGQPMTTDEVEKEYTPPPSTADRINALEEFNASLVATLAAHDIVVE